MKKGKQFKIGDKVKLISLGQHVDESDNWSNPMKTKADIEIEIQHIVEEYGYIPGESNNPTIVATGTDKIYELVKDHVLSQLRNAVAQRLTFTNYNI